MCRTGWEDDDDNDHPPALATAAESYELEAPTPFRLGEKNTAASADGYDELNVTIFGDSFSRIIQYLWLNNSCFINVYVFIKSVVSF